MATKGKKCNRNKTESKGKREEIKRDRGAERRKERGTFKR
jgi:hypothetical protein